MDYRDIYYKLFDYIKNKKNKEFIAELSKIDMNDISFDINIRDDSGNYFISYAIVTNNIEIVEYLLKKNIRLDVENNNNSILTIPIHYFYNELLELLLKANEHDVGIYLINYRDKNQKIPLHHAIEKKNIIAIELLLKYKSNVNITDKDGENALFYAVRSQSIDICKIILEYISNINAKNNSGENVLHIACSLQLYDMAQLLVQYKIQINIHDNTTEFTPLHYSVLMNNSKLTELLINNNGDVNTQDINGNTPLHYIIMKQNYSIFMLLLENEFTKNTLIFNLWNIEGDLPLHILLKGDIIDDDKYIEYLNVMIEKTNLNIQDKDGNSCLYYLIHLGLWKKYTSILVKKKLDIFIVNKDKSRLIDMVPKKEYEQFMNLIYDSYLYNLKHLGKQWTYEWDIICGKSFSALTANDRKKIMDTFKLNNVTDDIFINKCKLAIKTKIDDIIQKKEKKSYDKSFPVIKPTVCVNISEGSGIDFCTFTGSILDVLIGLIYLLKTHKNACSIVLKDDIDHTEHNCYGNLAKNKCNFFTFEIVWANKKLTIGKNFSNHFNECLHKKKRFVIIPLGIEMNEGNHAGYLIYDAKIKELERFETYGGGFSLYGTFYNPVLLDSLLESKFKEIDKDIKYIKPYQYLPKIGFQIIDITEKKKKKIGDPAGFCALWSVWYVDMRLTYNEIPRDKLVSILITTIKHENISFRNMIRNYASKVIDIRDDLLAKSHLNINDWVNEQYTSEQFSTFINAISKLL